MFEKSEILEFCVQDRDRSLEHQKVNWYKGNAIDLILKFYILLINSWGKKNTVNDSMYIFVDEVKNSNMINNLKNTQTVFSDNKMYINRMCMYRIDRCDHVRIGYFLPVSLMFSLTVKMVVTIISSVYKRKIISIDVMNVLIDYFWRYLSKFENNVISFLVMSDHHFYSSLIAFKHNDRSAVLQHGLVMDKRFYYPIRATHFYAWGKRSKELLENDEKVIICGTYKFDNIKRNSIKKKKVDKIIFCISSLDSNVVKKKIDCLYELAQNYKFELIVKCHPGSLFKLDSLKSIYEGKNINFYQEELLDSILFDLAITENSTVIIDLLFMKKPFILFDKIEGYFSGYNDIIPHGENYKEIENCIINIDKYDYGEINRILCSIELNNCECTILKYEKELSM